VEQHDARLRDWQGVDRADLQHYDRESACFFQAEDGIRDFHVTRVQTCALPIFGAQDDLWAESDAVRIPGRKVDRRRLTRRGVNRSEERRVGKERRARVALGSEDQTSIYADQLENGCLERNGYQRGAHSASESRL